MSVKVRMKGSGTMPGINSNLNNTKAIQDFINSQIYAMGFQFGVSVGVNTNIPIKLSGSSRRLFGLCLFVQSDKVNDDDTFSLTINQENIITTSLWRAWYPSVTLGNYKPQMFFPIPRPLSGSDSVNISWTAVTAKQVYPIFYLSDSEE